MGPNPTSGSPMVRRYSRLITVQENKHKRQAFIWIFLSILLIGVLLFWGIPTLVRVAIFLSDLRGSEAQKSSDSIAPAPPRWITQSIATSSATFKVSGTAEAESELLFFHNGNQESLAVNREGTFEKEVRLAEGENSFTARTKDQADNESQNSTTLTIFFDSTPPEIEITQPQEGQLFGGRDQQTIIIQGGTNEEARVMINGRLATELSDNKFQLQTQLTEGENSFTVTAVDQAGNSTEKIIKVSFSF